MISKLFGTKNDSSSGNYYPGSTQRWLPIETIKDGLVILKDKRYIKIIEILPVNFYLKSDMEQENIIYYFSSYLKIAPDNMQIRIITERANIDDYLKRHEHYAQNETNEHTISMIYDEMDFVKSLSENVSIKKRFFIIFEYSSKMFSGPNTRFSDVHKVMSDEVYKAQRYLSQCELGVIDICDNAQLLDLLYGFINKQSSKFVKPGNFANGMFEEIHEIDGGDIDE